LALDPLHASAGEVPPLLLARQLGIGDINLAWPVSCENSDDDFAVYEGTLGGDFQTHLSRFCSTGGATDVTFTPNAESSYYLVVPTVGNIVEGSYGQTSFGRRPRSASPCLNQDYRTCPECEENGDCLPPDICLDGVCSVAACSLGCNCCTGGNGAGCDCTDCEEIVCAIDSFCCESSWDTLCDTQAVNLCACC